MSNESGAVSSLNQSRARTQTAAGGVSMNISTGSPHVLLFERDQQFAVLLSSELQLAGYECHTARTAVEVFDAIARYSIRLVLVNLAQAAAARREFWVALDTQRRGRGVQVLTFHCSNLAGYGPTSDDPDDRSHIMLADLEVDGMPGIMNMVNAIRSRIALPNNSAISRPVSGAGFDARQQGTTATNEGNRVPQSTLPLANATTNNGVSFQGRNPPTPAPTVPNPPSPPPFNSAMGASSPQQAPGVNHTDKLRATIYPNQRSWSIQRDADSPPDPNSVGNQNSVPVNMTPSLAPSIDRQPRNEEVVWQPQNQPEQKESGLAQLSRMVQEHRAPLHDTTHSASNGQGAASLSEATLPPQHVRPPAASSISALPLRASPIEDLPTDRITSNSRSAYAESGSIGSRPDGFVQGNTNQHYQSGSALASIAMPVSPSPVAEPAKAALSPEYHEPEPVPVSSVSNNGSVEAQPEQLARDEVAFTTGEAQQQRVAGRQSQEQHLAEQLQSMLQKQMQPQSTETEKSPPSNGGESTLQKLMPVQSPQHNGVVTVKPTEDNALLFDIVQSLPPMSSPPPQQMLSGRATRSLGSVLLEGHLVPQDRLEVARGIQRMLRGVDMNYQLGEILLMFKLLTPDQLLAASLVSYGLITTTQISALGRIRQELHSIGLEYDLENLLILFRILTSEQLREVRSA
ncbi:MAG TPA: hypothetical protein VNG51_29510 [Ktedonobacteraceae bacterium]|nr:hypothetical protein [Ktedonobacteraceae bacterium]